MFENEIKRFVVGKVYKVHSVCNHDCIWSFKVIARTAKTITIESLDNKEWNGGKVSKINAQYTEHRKAETVFPLGRYSMCPVLSADL